MPLQSGSGWTGIPWHFCDCHQWQWPVSELKRQDGLLVCPYGLDNPQRSRSVDQRAYIILQRLSDPTEEPELAEILKVTDDNTENL